MTENGKLKKESSGVSFPAPDTESDDDGDFIQQPVKPTPTPPPHCHPPSPSDDGNSCALEADGPNHDEPGGKEENVGAEVVCPLCWKKLSDKLGGMAHVKSCGRDLPTDRLIQALQLHEKQVKEWESIGIKYPGFEAQTGRGRGRARVQSVAKQPSKRRKRNPSADPELDLAMALSASLSEDVELRKKKERKFMSQIGLGEEVEPPTETLRCAGQRSTIENKPPSSLRIRFGKEPKKKIPKQLPTHNTTTFMTGGLFASNPPKGRGKVDITKSRLYTLTTSERNDLIGQRVSQVMEEILEDTDQVKERYKFGHHQIPVGVSERLKTFVEKDCPAWTFATGESESRGGSPCRNDLYPTTPYKSPSPLNSFSRVDDDEMDLGGEVMSLSPGPKEPYQIFVNDSNTTDRDAGDKSVELIEIDDDSEGGGWDCGPAELDQGFLMDSMASEGEEQPPPADISLVRKAENENEKEVWDGDSFFATIPETDEIWREDDKHFIPPTPIPATPVAGSSRRKSRRSLAFSPNIMARVPSPTRSPSPVVPLPKKRTNKEPIQKKAKIMLPRKGRAPKVGPVGGRTQVESSVVGRTPGNLIGRSASQSPPRTPNHLSPAAGTPMLNYSIIDTPILKAELKRYGLKPFPRSKAKVILRHIYKETHKK